MLVFLLRHRVEPAITLWLLSVQLRNLLNRLDPVLNRPQCQLVYVGLLEWRLSEPELAEKKDFIIQRQCREIFSV